MCKGCGIKQCSYSFPGLPRSHCKGCSTSGMVGRVQKNKCVKCHAVRRSWGLPGSVATHCTKCRYPEMHRKYNMCQVCETKSAWFGREGQYTRCEECKDEDMQPLKPCRQGNCQKCGVMYVAPCDGRLCPLCRPTTRVRTREDRAVQYLLENIPGVMMVRDKKIGGGCSKRRPDILFDAGTHFVVVEIDELQHAGYDRACENRRMYEIAQDCGLPTVFVRWNPDEWRMHNVLQHVPMAVRLQTLCDYVQRAMKKCPSEGYKVDIVWLYYDDKELGVTDALQAGV